MTRHHDVGEVVEMDPTSLPGLPKPFRIIGNLQTTTCKKNQFYR